MLNVFCLYAGDAYSIEYVENLVNGVKQNLKQDYVFHIFTDRKDQLAQLKLLGNVILLPKLNVPKLWWYKLYMFNKANIITGPVLYLDLDVIIIGDLDKFVTTDNKLRIIHDFNRSNVAGGQYNKSNSSTMSWVFEHHTNMWGRFNENMDKYTSKMHGDQDFIHLFARNKEWWPDNWAISYKWEYCRNKLYDPSQTSILVFHGKPKPNDITDVALKKIWQYNK